MKQKKQEEIAGHGKQYRLITSPKFKFSCFYNGNNNKLQIRIGCCLVLQKRMVSHGARQIGDWKHNQKKYTSNKFRTYFDLALQELWKLSKPTSDIIV